MKSSVGITCKVCDKGEMTLKKKYRMSGIVAFIGWIFLIPSFIGILIGLVGFFGTGAAVEEVSQSTDAEYRKTLQDAGCPKYIVTRVMNAEAIPDNEMSRLTPEQKGIVETVQAQRVGSQIGAGAGAVVAGGMSIFIIIGSICGGLLGWLLTMKKKVLQCKTCGAVVAAS